MIWRVAGLDVRSVEQGNKWGTAQHGEEAVFLIENTLAIALKKENTNDWCASSELNWAKKLSGLRHGLEMG